jgi:hypothetical protein
MLKFSSEYQFMVAWFETGCSRGLLNDVPFVQRKLIGRTLATMQIVKIIWPSNPQTRPPARPGCLQANELLGFGCWKYWKRIGLALVTRGSQE